MGRPEGESNAILLKRGDIQQWSDHVDVLVQTLTNRLSTLLPYCYKNIIYRHHCFLIFFFFFFFFFFWQKKKKKKKKKKNFLKIIISDQDISIYLNIIKELFKKKYLIDKFTEFGRNHIFLKKKINIFL